MAVRWRRELVRTPVIASASAFIIYFEQTSTLAARSFLRICFYRERAQRIIRLLGRVKPHREANMAAAWLSSSRNLFITLVSIVGICVESRGELYELPLPIMGEYTLLNHHKDFEVSLGFPLADVQSVRFKVEGTMTSTLS